MYTDILDTINREQEVRENINYEIIIVNFLPISANLVFFQKSTKIDV